ncbi:uncharacterized protein C57A7.06 [Rhodamnia argentea]|uniref:Uncharacterized protein C57A7.06 n=1 Tax=Rhodamnia argentea TaxID=178133 RepID=A0A8B8PCX5_9MYRT|nr:uncharacterized protein C57A7.06 [Rhodamnia argentea]
MAEKKSKSGDSGRPNNKRNQSMSKTLPKDKNNNKKLKNKRKRTGPRLPNALRKEVERLNPLRPSDSEGEEIDSDEAEFGNGRDVYEYEEEAPPEESRRNRRFDPVDNLEYELPDEFEDEIVSSDDEEDVGRSDDANLSDAEAEDDEGRHIRMLQEITGMPSETFQGKKRKKGDLVVSEAYPESEFNPSHNVGDGDGRITIQDLLDPLHGKAGYSKLRKRTSQMERKPMSIQAPLPKPYREKLERKVAYEQSKKDITKWEPLVKRNREAPTIYFDQDLDLGFSTVGAIASEFEPRTEFEKKIASLVHDDKVKEAHEKDGARLLELNKTSIEDEKERRDRIAKMRSLLFRHEIKQKHIKKIKSKTYHRLMKKDRAKATSAQIEMDPEAAKEQAMKQEFKRAEERMTLKHKNSSKWAKRILQRGLTTQDEGTRAAISEQLHQHALLTRKMNSMKDGSSSEESSDEYDDENSVGSDQDKENLLAKAKEKTLKVFEEDDEVPNTGVLSLPFMARGLKKKRDAAVEEARLALQEYESSSKQMEDSQGIEDTKENSMKGRMVFGAVQLQAPGANNVSKSEKTYDDSDGEDDMETRENIDGGSHSGNDMQNQVQNGSTVLHPDSETHDYSVFKSFDDIVKNPGAKTTYEVAIFASDGWRKMKGSNKETAMKKKQDLLEPASQKKDLEEASGDSDTESEGQMVDGILSSGPTQSYELPSQADLIRHAFAGDDVEEDFDKHKMEILNEENPEPEKPIVLPGWGQWTHIQQKKGLPSWMLREHENAKKTRQDALKKRKDAHLKNVIISEKVDKKAEKLHTKSLPFPFTSKDVFEQSIRMPIGPEFNPATAIGALNRPEVVKKSGTIIKPIKFEEVNPHEKAEYGNEQKHLSKKKEVGKSSKKNRAKAKN